MKHQTVIVVGYVSLYCILVDANQFSIPVHLVLHLRWHLFTL